MGANSGPWNCPKVGVRDRPTRNFSFGYRCSTMCNSITETMKKGGPPNKALHLTANPLRVLAAGDLSR